MVWRQQGYIFFFLKKNCPLTIESLFCDTSVCSTYYIAILIPYWEALWCSISNFAILIKATHSMQVHHCSGIDARHFVLWCLSKQTKYWYKYMQKMLNTKAEAWVHLQVKWRMERMGWEKSDDILFSLSSSRKIIWFYSLKWTCICESSSSGLAMRRNF